MGLFRDERESGRIFAELFDLIDDAVIMVDKAGQITRVNRSAAKKLQYPMDELMQMSLFDFDLAALEIVHQAGRVRERPRGPGVVLLHRLQPVGRHVPDERLGRVEIGGGRDRPAVDLEQQVVRICPTHFRPIS